MLLQIFYFIVYLIEGLIFYEYCSALFQPKQRAWQRCLFLVFLYGILFGCFTLGISVLNMVSFLLANFIYIAVIYHISLHEALFHAVITTTVMTFSEVIVYYIVPYRFSYPIHSWRELEPWILPVALMKAIYFILVLLLTRNLKGIHANDPMSDRSSLLMAAISAFSLFIMYTLTLIRLYSPLSPKFFPFISASTVILLLLNLLIWEIFKYIHRKNAELNALKSMNERVEGMNLYYQMLLEQNEKQGKLIHDTKKHLQSIAALNELGERERVADYIGSILDSPILKCPVHFSDCELLNAILSRYTRLCQESGTHFYVDVRSKTVDFMDDEDITSLFCNLLDNAFESASKMPNGTIDLAVYRRENMAFTVVALKNSCRVNPFKEKSGRLPSTKPDPSRHGYGLRIIDLVLKKYHGEVHRSYTEEDHMFHSVLTLYNPRRRLW